MKKIIVLILGLVAFSNYSFACGGGDGELSKIELNDDKVLFPWALKDLSSGEEYYFAEDLKNGFTEYNVKNSIGELTHHISLSKNENGRIVVVLSDLIEPKNDRVLIGQEGVYRGCNEFSDITKN